MEFKEWAPWVGIAASLGWNLINTIRGEIRSNRSTAFVEFKSLKTPCDTAISELRTRKASLSGMQVYAGDDFGPKIQAINADLAESYNKLVVALETLDGSTHSKKADWVEAAATKWDDFISAFDRIYAPKTQAERSQLIAIAVQRLQAMLDYVQTQLEREGNAKLRPPSRLMAFCRRRTGYLITIAAIVAAGFFMFKGEAQKAWDRVWNDVAAEPTPQPADQSAPQPATPTE